MTGRVSTLLAIDLLAGALAAAAPSPADPPAPTDGLAKAFREADAVFTATVGTVKPLGQTNSIPAGVFGEVTFKDAKAVRGTVPAVKAFGYGYREKAKQNLDLEAAGPVLVAVKWKGVVAVVPATEANLELAEKSVPAQKK